jgi:hypothetical protein
MIPKLNEDVKQAIESTKVDWWKVSGNVAAAGGFAVSLYITPDSFLSLVTAGKLLEKTPKFIEAAKGSLAKWRGAGRPK